MDRDQCGMGLREAPHRRLATMRRAVVHDPEDAASGVVRRLAHDLLDQTLEGRDAGGRFAATEHLGAMHVQRSQVRPGATACALMLNAHRFARLGRQARMDAHASLDAGLLVGRDDELVVAQHLSLPTPFVQVRTRPALAWKCGSRGKIQQRCCQGRIASSCNQRHTVLSLMRATRPERCACRATSATLSRDSGKPKVVGRSQASALISIVSSGGGRPGASRAWGATLILSGRTTTMMAGGEESKAA